MTVPNTSEVFESIPEDNEHIRSLEGTALRAAAWSVVEYGTATGLRVISSLVLTRLLAPALFGEVTLLTTIIVGINLLSDIGLAPSVIQSPNGDEPDFLNTAWTLQVMRGVGLWLVALAVTWPMALLYHDDHLKTLLPVIAFCSVLNGFNSTNLLSLSRHMKVRRLFAIDVSSSALIIAIAVVWAMISPTVWAIIGAQVISAFYKMCISHIPRVAPGIRNKFQWEDKSVRAIAHFGRWIFIGTAFYFFASQADRLVLGKIVSLSMLGIYGLAYSLSDIPRQIILAIGTRVAFPFTARIIDLPREEFRKRFFRYRSYTLLIGMACLTVMVLWGHLLILKLYDARYHYGAWMIPVLALGLWHTLLYQTTAPVLFSLAKPKYNAIGNAAYSIFILAAIPTAYHFYGMVGAVVAIAAGDLPMYVVIAWGATREGVSPFRQDALLTGAFAGMLAACFALKHAALWMMHAH